MAVLLTYHKLVERDEKNVQMHWKVSSMLLLILCIFFSFWVSVTLQNLIHNFDTRCILGAQIKFIEINPKPENVSEFTSQRILVKSLFNETFADFITTNEASNEFPTSQVQFLAQNEIDLTETAWGTQLTCDYAIYIPLFQCLFSIIMVVMFAICGRGGKSEPSAFLPQPWRIVTPALFFNIIMTVLSIIDTTIIETGLNGICKSLTSQTPDISCGIAMNRFMLAPMNQTLIPPSIQRKMLTSFGFINLGFWVLSVAVLIARILFVIDFQLIKVTVKTKENEKKNEDETHEDIGVNSKYNTHEEVKNESVINISNLQDNSHSQI